MLVALPILSRGYVRHGRGGERNEHAGHGSALHHLRPEDIPVTGVEVEAGEHEHGGGSDQESEDEEPAYIHAGGDGADDEGQGKGSDAARGERESGLHRWIIEQGFKILRKQDHAGVEAEADQRHQQHSDGKGAVFERAQIDNWLVDGQLADDEEQQSHDAAECLDADFARAEPVLALSGVEEDLQRSQAEGEQADTPEIHIGISLALDIGRIVDKRAIIMREKIPTGMLR